VSSWRADTSGILNWADRHGRALSIFGVVAICWFLLSAGIAAAYDNHGEAQVYLLLATSLLVLEGSTRLIARRNRKRDRKTHEGSTDDAGHAR
jgi:hypothetical protein